MTHRCSLPLMGIGNSTSVMLLPLPLLLITPHGDRKPAGATRHASGRAYPAHYPSWGSETLGDVGFDLPAIELELITPHGDRKRAGSTGAPARQRRHSLPLMGIGNMVAVQAATGKHRIRTHYPSWGSETSENWFQSMLDGGALITPHGDRKPGGKPLRASASDGAVSLPLMGIGNPPTCKRWSGSG